MASLVALTVVCFFHKTGLPGVLFVLPDSYVDAENKDYGGKFIARVSCMFLLSWVRFISY